MKIEGIDRVVIGVKDLDRALEFFSKVFEVDFVEMKGPATEAGGVRFAVNLDKHIELISPVYPLKDINPPNPMKLAKLLEEQGDGALFAIAFKVENAAEAAADLERKGIGIVTTLELEQAEPFTKSIFREVFAKDEDTLGIGMAFCEYEPMKKDKKLMEETTKIEGISRLIIGVKDMDKALEFFSEVFEVDFVEMKGPLVEAGGVRIAISVDKKLELLSPIYPLKDVSPNPPDPNTLAKLLEERGDGILYALVFKVEDATKAAADAERKGIGIVTTLELEQGEPFTKSNYKEVVLNEDDTLDIKMAFAEYEPVKKE